MTTLENLEGEEGGGGDAELSLPKQFPEKLPTRKENNIYT